MLGLSQEKLGEAIGLTFQQVQKYERGANRISASRLLELARVLDVPIAFFYDDVDPVRAPPIPEGFAEPAGEERDQLRLPETIELIEAYYGIPDPTIRRRLVAVAKSLAVTGSAASEAAVKPQRRTTLGRKVRQTSPS